MVGPFAEVAELIAAGLKAPVGKLPRIGCVLGSEGSCMPHRHHVVGGPASARQHRETKGDCKGLRTHIKPLVSIRRPSQDCVSAALSVRREALGRGGLGPGFGVRLTSPPITAQKEPSARPDKNEDQDRAD